MNHWRIAQFVLIILACRSSATADRFEDFIYTSDGASIVITVYTGPGGEVVIPATISGLPVTTIGDDAFYLRYFLTSVVIPDSVTTVGDGAFSECSGLTSVVIPDSVTTIGDGLFSSCDSLTEIVVTPTSLSPWKPPPTRSSAHGPAWTPTRWPMGVWSSPTRIPRISP